MFCFGFLPLSPSRAQICEMIRSLQSQLKTQMKANNTMKAELRPLVEKRMAVQAKEEEARKQWDAVLARYEEAAAAANKRKKE